MEDNKIKDQILETENEFPKYIVNSLNLDWATFYWDDLDKENAMFNHAIIHPQKVSDLSSSLAEVTKFYKGRGIRPRLFQPYTTGYFMEHADEFRRGGYDVQLFPATQFMLLCHEFKLSKKEGYEIQKLTQWDPKIAHDILIPDGNPGTAEQLRRIIGGKHYDVFAGYLEGSPVCVATVFYGDHNIARLSFAETVGPLRGQGYAKALVQELVTAHRETFDLPMYTQTNNISAQKLFLKSGFEPVFTEELASAVYNKAE